MELTNLSVGTIIAFTYSGLDEDIEYYMVAGVKENNFRNIKGNTLYNLIKTEAVSLRKDNPLLSDFWNCSAQYMEKCIKDGMMKIIPNKM